MDLELSDDDSVLSVLRYDASSDEYIPSESDLSGSDQELDENVHIEAGENMDLAENEAAEEEEPTSMTCKRKRNMSIQAKRQRSKNSGLSFKTRRGNVVLAKTFQNRDCNCRCKCLETISEESRQNAFNKFWGMGSFSTQNAFICGLVKQVKPERRRPRDGEGRAKSTTNQYFIILADGKTKKVCKKYFLETYQVSDGRLTRALKKVQGPGSDKRGKNVPSHKTLDDKMDLVRQHITSFPSYESHYTRAHNPGRKYLAESLNIREMYNLYKTFCLEQQVEPVKEPIYRRTFNTEFNLHFHAPYKDTCMKCDVFKNKIRLLQDGNEKKELETSHELHLRKAESARKAMVNDTEKAKSEDTFYTFTFDLEKAPFPKLSCSLAYYKRNCYLYNLGCHELSSGLGFMYCWDKTIGSRGSQEIAACITKHIAARGSNAEHVVMYSDACSGQNRNFKTSLLLMRFLHGQDDNRNLQLIDHKFMQSGHSYLPNDRDFASIEKF